MRSLRGVINSSSDVTRSNRDRGGGHETSHTHSFLRKKTSSPSNENTTEKKKGKGGEREAGERRKQEAGSRRRRKRRRKGRRREGEEKKEEEEKEGGGERDEPMGTVSPSTFILHILLHVHPLLLFPRHHPRSLLPWKSKPSPVLVSYLSFRILLLGITQAALPLQ